MKFISTFVEGLRISFFPLLGGLLLMGLCMFSFYWFFYMGMKEGERNTAIQQQEVQVIFTERYDLLRKLKHCESGGGDNERIAVKDVNGLWSVGYFQFQYPLFADWWEDEVGFRPTFEQYALMAMNGSIAEAVAGAIIEDGYSGGLRNWLLCSQKMGLIDE